MNTTKKLNDIIDTEKFITASSKELSELKYFLSENKNPNERDVYKVEEIAKCKITVIVENLQNAIHCIYNGDTKMLINNDVIEAIKNQEYEIKEVNNG